MRSVELFAGAGGLAIGVTRAGFKHDAIVEWDPDAVETLKRNQAHSRRTLAADAIFGMDVRRFDYSSVAPDLDLLAGGPPCQPFSLGGLARGDEDARNMFPEVFRAIREVRPKAVLIENVKGLLRRSFQKYFGYLELQLTYPELAPRRGEEWDKHLARLEQHHTSKRRTKGLTYQVTSRLLNAADFGVPQQRHRVFIVAFRSDLDVNWSFPDRGTHSQEALLRSQYVTGEYWERHKVPKSRRPVLPPKLSARVAELRSTLPISDAMPWVTVRDALQGLPDPRTHEDGEFANHRFQDGARAYPGHTGSKLDEPSKALKAGVHGVPGGENMLAYPDGSVRYFTVRESARIQTFPDDYEFAGSWTESMRQLGNAVPVKLGQMVAQRVADHLHACSHSISKS